MKKVKIKVTKKDKQELNKIRETCGFEKEDEEPEELECLFG